jgi:predicted RNase H-like HicB family nuclease
VAVNIAWYNLAMPTQYLEAAMRLAQYEYLTEDGVYYGEIPPLAGVWATGKTLEDCQQELREVLEEWVALRQQWGQSLPPVEGISLTQVV